MVQNIQTIVTITRSPHIVPCNAQGTILESWIILCRLGADGRAYFNLFQRVSCPDVLDESQLLFWGRLNDQKNNTLRFSVKKQ